MPAMTMRLTPTFIPARQKRVPVGKSATFDLTRQVEIQKRSATFHSARAGCASMRLNILKSPFLHWHDVH